MIEAADGKLKWHFVQIELKNLGHFYQHLKKKIFRFNAVFMSQKKLKFLLHSKSKNVE